MQDSGIFQKNLKDAIKEERKAIIREKKQESAKELSFLKLNKNIMIGQDFPLFPNGFRKEWKALDSLSIKELQNKPAKLIWDQEEKLGEVFGGLK